jgi:hypothetical protein
MRLYPYQIPEKERMVAAVRCHACALNAGDTGTGKTPETCAACKELGLRPAVVCPKNLIPVWRKACRDWGLPEPVFVLNYEAIRTGNTPWLKWVGQGARLRPLRGTTARRCSLRQHRTPAWRLPAGTILIFDEVHRCAGQDSLNSKMLAAVRRYGIPAICLSATAAESPLKLNGLGFVLRLHDGGESYWRFCAAHGCVKNFWGGVEFPRGSARPGSRRAYQIDRARLGLARLHETIFRPTGLPSKGTRVRIADLGEAFPETLVTAEAYDFGDEVAEAYREIHHEDTMDAKESNALVEMLRARQAAELLKAPGLAEMAADGVEEGQSVVIFVNFRATLAALLKLLPDLPVIEGETPMDERTDILRRFGADEVRVVAANLATAGEGLDGLQDLRGEFPRLTLISPGFNAVQLKQALGRVHRANARSKSVQRIVFAADTVEERACEAVRAKVANMALLNDGDLAAGMFTTEATKGTEVSHA